MAERAKQLEWIWEFFLKNCSDARLIHELMNGLPFPNDNLDLQKMFLLRSLSVQVSAGTVDESTLLILKGLGELRRVSEAGRKGCPVTGIEPDFPTLPKHTTDEKDGGASRFDEAANPTSPQEPTARTLPTDLENQSNSGNDGKRSESVVGIRDWMKGRALPRSIGGLGRVGGEKQTSRGIGTENFGLKSIFGDEMLLGAARPAKQWELELAVMAELTVKHLRQLRTDAADRVLFEQAIAKYWGDSLDDTETWDDADREEMIEARDHIRAEFFSLKTDSELIENAVKKYAKDRVEDILKAYLDKEWSRIGQTFLETVSYDVVNGKYNPINGSSHLPATATANLSENPDFGRGCGSRTHAIQKPGVRASRGIFSRSREKSQKKLTIWDLDDGGEGREGDLRTGTNEHEEPDVRKRGKDDDNTSVCPSVEGERDIDARARRLGLTGNGGIARILEFEEPRDESSLDGKDKREAQTEARTGIEDTTEGQPDLTNAPVLVASEKHAADRTGSSPTNYGNLNSGMLRPSDEVCSPVAEGEPENAQMEDQIKEPRQSTRTDGGNAELQSHMGTVDKENIVPPLPREPPDPNPNASCFIPPPWVTGSSAALDMGGEPVSLTTKRKSGTSVDKVSAATQQSPRADGVDIGENCTTEEHDATRTRRNLRRKQTALDAAAKDPLSNILPSSRATPSIMERNASARTLRWDEDDIESEPDSPSAARRVRLSRPISPLVGTIAVKCTCSPSGGSTKTGKQGRRKSRRWSDEEVSRLKEQVSKFGKGRWKFILERNLEIFQGRTEVDLKDKWRNLERFEGIRE